MSVSANGLNQLMPEGSKFTNHGYCSTRVNKRLFMDVKS